MVYSTEGLHNSRRES